ncbi:MAG: putative DNA binding domain-containing protein [Deltaproteobacteria bacterium]|nr:putative DNA binding domain-containing protein [Deltaproteobacteria bacterium]
MRSISEISVLLDELIHQPAGTLEHQDLDFKEWNTRSLPDAIALAVEMAICMANGGGGTVVFGINDKAIGRTQAILGVPPEVDVNRLKKAIYDQTDPKLTPVFEELSVPEGTQRLIVMQVYPGLPPYTDTAGKGKIRIGTDCQPLTGTLRRRIMVETGETDYTRETISESIETALSPTALEQLRETARKERAPEDLLQTSDMELLSAMATIRRGSLTRAGVLIAGKISVIRDVLPGYSWTYLRMVSETNYENRLDGHEALPIAINRIMDRIMAENPITTLTYGLFHFEYRTYPEVALREALLNAFCHADYRIGGPILIKHFPDRLEISDPGGFIGGVTPENILHHPPISRNPTLVDALSKLRLVNRSNLGVSRMFQALLVEGKDPPYVEELGETVRVTFQARAISPPFRSFIEEENKRGRLLNLDHLLILHHLTRHSEVETTEAAKLIQRSVEQTREILSRMEGEFDFLERGGAGRGTYWTLRSGIHQRLVGSDHPEWDRRIDWEAAKTRILSILMERARRGEPGLTNQEIRRISHYDRFQANRIMRELINENSAVGKEGTKRWTRYVYSM